jgi:MFS transporter, DHA1 family, multidrug resistance protein
MKLSESKKAPTVDEQSDRSILGFILILGSLSAFGPLSIDMYLPALPKLAAGLHTSASMTQLSLTACLLGIALGQIIAGPISDVRGRRGPLLIGLAVYAGSSLLCAYAPTIELFVLLRLVQGLAGSVGIVISSAAARDLYSGSDLTRFFSFLMLVNGAAPILAPIFGGLVLQFSAWRGVFQVLAAIGLLMWIAVNWGLKETLPAERRARTGLKSTIDTFGILLKNRKFMGYALSQGFASAAMFAYIAGSPFVIQNIFGVSPQMFSMFFAINGLGIIIAGQITGRVAGRVPERKLLAIGLSLAFGGGLSLLAAIIAGSNLFVILVSLFFVVSSVGIIGTSSFSLAMQDQANSAGSAAALIGLLSFVFGGALAPLVGVAGASSALPMGIVIMLAETAAGLSYWLLIRK